MSLNNWKRLSDCIKTSDSAIHCLQKTHFKYKDKQG